MSDEYDFSKGTRGKFYDKNATLTLPADLDADIDENMYRRYVMDKIRKSRDAIELGDVIRHEELKREIDKW